MKINLIVVGKVKEKYLRDAIQEYAKRLSAYCDLSVVEVTDEKTPEHAPETVEARIKETEGSVSSRRSVTGAMWSHSPSRGIC